MLKEYGALMVGQWECKECIPWGSAPGAAKVAIRGTCSWTADGAALDWDFQVGDAKARALDFWDPVSKRLKEFVVASTGDCFEVFITKEDGKWVSTAEIVAADGKRTEVRLETTFDKDGGKHVNKYPTHEEVFTRVK